MSSKRKKSKGMKNNMAKEKDTAKNARKRFYDQPGQWKDTTPESVKKKQNEWFEKFKKENPVKNKK